METSLKKLLTNSIDQFNYILTNLNGKKGWENLLTNVIGKNFGWEKKSRKNINQKNWKILAGKKVWEKLLIKLEKSAGVEKIINKFNWPI